MNKTTLAEIRRAAADTIIALKNGKCSPLVSDAIYKQELIIVDSYRVELRGVELAINSSKKRLDYDKAIKVLTRNKA